MSRILLGIVIGTFALYAYQRTHKPAAEVTEPPAAAEETEIRFVEQPASPAAERRDNDSSSPAFHCDGRQHCSQMKSCDEAEYFLEHCPDVKMDGDGDGRPCEDMCGH